GPARARALPRRAPRSRSAPARAGDRPRRVACFVREGACGRRPRAGRALLPPRRRTHALPSRRRARCEPPGGARLARCGARQGGPVRPRARAARRLEAAGGRRARAPRLPARRRRRPPAGRADRPERARRAVIRPTATGLKAALFLAAVTIAYFVSPYTNLFFLLLAFL